MSCLAFYFVRVGFLIRIHRFQNMGLGSVAAASTSVSSNKRESSELAD